MKHFGWVVFLFLLVGCGGDGGGGGGGGIFDGTWGGTIEDPSGTLGVLTVSFSGLNMSGSSTVGGAFSGTIAQETGNI